MTGRVQEYRQNRCLFDLLSGVVDFLVIQIIFFLFILANFVVLLWKIFYPLVADLD